MSQEYISCEVLHDVENLCFNSFVEYLYVYLKK
jgi:hypothetical protein